MSNVFIDFGYIVANYIPHSDNSSYATGSYCTIMNIRLLARRKQTKYMFFHIVKYFLYVYLFIYFKVNTCAMYLNSDIY